MSSTPTRVYPLRDRHVPGVPHVVTELDTKAEAEALEATGAFSTNPRHPDRIPDAEINLPVDEPTHVATAEGNVLITRADPADVPVTEPPVTEQPAASGEEA